MENQFSTEPPRIEEQLQQDSARAGHTGQDRVIRDGFSMPASDYDLMLEVRAELLRAGVHATKSGVLRAAIHALKQLSTEDVVQLLGELEPIKTGRPATIK